MDTIAQKPKSPLWLFPAALAVSVGAQFFLPLYLVLPALIAAALFYDHRPISVVLLAAANYGTAILLFGDSRAALISAVCIASLGYVCGIAVWQLQQKKSGGFHTAAITAAIAIAALYLSTCLEGVISGAGAFAASEQYAAAVADEITALIETSGLPEAETFLETYGAFLEGFEDMFVLLLVPMLCVCGCILGLSNTLLFRLFIRRDREAFDLVPFRPLRDWSIPKEYSIGITVMLIGSMILLFMETEFSDAVSTTVITLISFPLTVQAFAFIDWLIVRKGTRIAFKRTLMIILIVGLYNFISNILVTVGIFEQIFHARAHLSAMGMGPKPPTSEQEDKK